MEYINSSDFKIDHTAVALGKFEGIHSGHQLLFNEIKKYKKNGMKSVVFTFDMPPRSALKGEKTFKQIYTREERRTILKDMGIDILIEHPFTREFASLKPEEFIRDVLVKKAGAKIIVVGTDFRFGKNRAGGIEHLKALEKECGYQLIVIHKLQQDGMDVSSTRIRTLLEKGEMEKANELLGRPYTVIGPVVHGKALGRTLQIPTVNQLVADNKLVPPNGVYVSKVLIDDDIYFGITNIGTKPTIEDNVVKGVETNIFDFNKDVYDKVIQVELLTYKRPEIKFCSLEELKNQMNQDIAFGKEYVLELKG